VGIVCLIADGPHQRYFVNRLNEAHGVDLVVIEAGRRGAASARRAYATGGLAGAADAIGRAARHRLGARARRRELDRRIGSRWRTLPPGVPCLRVDSINDPGVAVRLQAGEAELLSHGTSIARPPLLSRASLALNLHWGLAPYYRGVNCTAWALIGWDPCNIGVTVHEMTAEIDGGPIFGQARAAVGSDDTLDSIRMQLTYLGTEIMVEAIRRLRAGEQLSLTAQDISLGRLTLKRDWTARHRRDVERIERDGTIARMLASPSRRELPIVAV